MDVPAPRELLRHRDSSMELEALNSFLASVERRAFLMARTSLGDTEDALDVVQDAMLTLTRKYGHKEADEWRPLFFRIVQNRIYDYHRRRKLWGRFSSWFNQYPAEEEANTNPIEQFADAEHNNPEYAMAQSQSMDKLRNALKDLPRRQQQAFMLRCWEGLSTADTALAMNCSEGSVKTHYFRALQSLKEELKEYRDE